MSAIADTRRDRVLIAFVLLTIAVFYIATLRPGHRWGDDFAMYIHHAENLAEGIDYKATGYVFNPMEPHLGPPVYPPVLPFYLAPVYKLFGMDLRAMKIELILAFVLSLYFVYELLRPYLPPAWRAAVVAILGFNPQYWNLKDDILSECLFFLFSYASLLIIQRAYEEGGRRTIAKAGLLGLCMYLSCGARNVGIVLFPALILYDLWKCRRPTMFAWLSAVIGGALVAVQVGLIHSNEGVNGLFRLSPKWLVYNSLEYFKASRRLWLNGFSSAFSYLVFAIAYALLVWAVLHFFRQIPGIVELFSVLYLGLIVSYSVPGNPRYLLPVFPFYLAYVCMGIRDLIGRLSVPVAKAAVVIATLAVIVTYAGDFSKEDWGPIHEGIGDENFRAVCDYIKNNTHRGDVVLFRKPRIMALLSDHPSGTYPSDGNPAEIQHSVEQMHAAYIVVASVPSEDFDPDVKYLQPFINTHNSEVEQVYANPAYRLYHVRTSAGQ